MGMTLMIDVCCTGIEQCGPLQASTLTLGVARALNMVCLSVCCSAGFGSCTGSRGVDSTRHQPTNQPADLGGNRINTLIPSFLPLKTEL